MENGAFVVRKHILALARRHRAQRDQPVVSRSEFTRFTNGSRIGLASRAQQQRETRTGDLPLKKYLTPANR
jgi:hypothetical protein